jgi:hypothetical protein
LAAVLAAPERQHDLDGAGGECPGGHPDGQDQCRDAGPGQCDDPGGEREQGQHQVARDRAALVAAERDDGLDD